MKKPTIYEALRDKLGREPSHSELCADVRRILGHVPEPRCYVCDVTHPGLRTAVHDGAELCARHYLKAHDASNPPETYFGKENGSAFKARGRVQWERARARALRACAEIAPNRNDADYYAILAEGHERTAEAYLREYPTVRRALSIPPR